MTIAAPGDTDYTEEYRADSRVVRLAQPEDLDELGPYRLLPGTWMNSTRFADPLLHKGYNMIALPFAGGTRLDYRLLVNEFTETLTFSLVDKRVPNRGIDKGASDDPLDSTNTDQLVVTLDYEQMIEQSAADDRPDSALEGSGGLAIHHEPGLFLHMGEPRTDGLNVARLASIPHGNSALALGTAFEVPVPAQVAAISGLPIGGPVDIDHPYLAPYKHYRDNPFRGVFDPVDPNRLLIEHLPQNVVRNTVIPFDTTIAQGGIHNIPFVEQQADAAEMTATFWILELDGDGVTEPNLLLAYTQTVMLEFFARFDGQPGLIRWPHVSINVMEKIAEPDYRVPAMPSEWNPGDA